MRKKISASFRELKEDKDFYDVTLACDDDQIQAHKVIYSVFSPLFFWASHVSKVSVTGLMNDVELVELPMLATVRFIHIKLSLDFF